MRGCIVAFVLTLIVVCLVAAAAWAQAAPAAQQPTRPAEAAAQKGSIAGQVVNAVTNEPVRKVTLTLSAATGTPLGVTAETDDTGHFVFQNLPAGRYQLIGERTGFARQAYGARNHPFSGTSVVLSAGQEIKDVVFELAPTAVIAGRVLDDEGEPLGTVIVFAMAPSYSRGKRDFTPLATAQTNDMGEFRLSGLKAGRYVVAATYRNLAATVSPSANKPAGDKPEMAFTTTYFPNVTDSASASFVEVGVGAEVHGTDIQMVKVPAFRVKGKVPELPQGKTMLATLTPRGAGVTALLTRPMALVQQDGTFEFKGVPPGSYLLSAMGPDMSTSTLLQAVEVGDQHVEGVALQVTPGGDLPLNISVEGKTAVDLKTLRISLNQSDFAAMPKTAAFEDGRFVIKSVTPARYDVRVSSLPENVYVRTIRLGMTDAEDVLDLTAGVRGTLQIVLSGSGGQVDGTVRGEDGNPLPGATVTLIPDSKRTSLYKEMTTDQQGAFSFKGVTPGDYKIIAWEDIENGAAQNAEFVKQFESDAQPTTVKENDRKALSLKAISAEKTARASGR